MKYELERLNLELPQNKNHSKDQHNDKLIRNLDCAVIEYCYTQMDIEIDYHLKIMDFLN
jgi:hypothetical protein